MMVDVYSGCDEAELLLNGKSLGRKKTNASTELIASWNVPYEEGELRTLGYVGGKVVSEYTLKTAGRPASIRLTSDRKTIAADGSDVCYVTVEVVGENGVRNTLSNHEIAFQVDGPVTIAGVGSSSPYAPVGYPFHGNKCRVLEGRALLILRSGTKKGIVTVKATSDGLRSGSVTITSGS